MILIFGILVFAVFYTYFGYALLIALLTIGFKRKQTKRTHTPESKLPEVCLFITAYNEYSILAEKIQNCRELDYPKQKLKIVFVTDGSNDGSPEFLATYPEITVYHENERRGKINAMNRGMQFVKSPIVVFTDANTSLNPEAIKVIAYEFSDPKVGCVAGRKRVIPTGAESAAEAGEGLYWKFESWLKAKDAQFHSAVGAVGELFAIRTELFEPVEPDTILDDLIISFRIVEKGFRLAYVPGAVASEKASFNVREELKRKTRIAAGGIQTMLRTRKLLNPLRNGRLAFQYFSHKVTRWTFAPWCFFLLLPVNIVLALDEQPEQWHFKVLLILQLTFYILGLFGYIFEKSRIKNMISFIAYYFIAINMATIIGQFRYLKGKQSAAWDKAKRI
jgi:cellulose synthase/poly-beta-1,6-N-acetylglucosamine synthase-like glycosyltransferase